MSATRKRYFARLVGRCLIFVLCVLLCLFRPGDFAVLDGMNFFKTPLAVAPFVACMGRGHVPSDHPHQE